MPDKYVEIEDTHGRTYHINLEQIAAIVTKKNSGFLYVYFVAGNSVEIETYGYNAAVKYAARLRGIDHRQQSRGSF